jgi:hypothetical protein
VEKGEKEEEEKEENGAPVHKILLLAIGSTKYYPSKAMLPLLLPFLLLLLIFLLLLSIGLHHQQTTRMTFPFLRLKIR